MLIMSDVHDAHRLRSSGRERREWQKEEDEVKLEEIEMIPKSGKSPAESKKSVGIHEFAALARSSLNGISQAVRDHVTKPTSLAQGRVAHLIEWKGWPKPVDPPSAPYSHFSSYCHLTEVEKEARFAAGVAEQFAIAEAKLRAWASIDDDDALDCNDEDSHTNGQTHNCSSQVSDAAKYNLVTGTCQSEVNGSEKLPFDSRLGSSSSSSSSSLLSGRPDDPCASHTSSPTLTTNCVSPFLEEEEEEEEAERTDGREEQSAPLQEERSEVCIHQKPDWRPRARSSRFDSCYSTSESPGEEDEEDDEDGSVFHEGRVWHCSPRGFFSDRTSSGVASFDEEEERDEVEREDEKEFLM